MTTLRLRMSQGNNWVEFGAGVFGNTQTANSILLDYDLRSAEVDASVITEIGVDGGTQIGAAYRDVTESCVVAWRNVNDYRAQHAIIANMFTAARDYQRFPVGNPVFIQGMLGVSMWWSSEILNGTIRIEEDTLDFGLANEMVICRVAWTRRFYWEGQQGQLLASTHYAPTPTAASLIAFNPCINVQLTNGIGFTAPNIIYNNSFAFALDSNSDFTYWKVGDPVWVRGSVTNDGQYTVASCTPSQIVVTQNTITTQAVGGTRTVLGRCANSLLIPASEIEGDLPTPAFITYTNYNPNVAGNQVDRLYVGNFYKGLASSAGAWMGAEGEWITTSAGITRSTVEDFAASQGSYVHLSWSGTGEKELGTWNLSQTLLNATLGAYFRVFLLVRSGFVGWLSYKLKFQGGFIQEGSRYWVDGTGDLLDLGLVQLPPYHIGAYYSPLPDFNEIDIALYAETTSGSNQLDLDNLTFLPTDAWRDYTATGYGLPTMVTLVDDGPRGFVYVRGWNGGGEGNKTGTFDKDGEPVWLYPGRANRLFLLQDTADGARGVDKMRVQISARPRRLNLA